MQTKTAIRQFEVSQSFDIELAADRFFRNRSECAKHFFKGAAAAYRDKMGCYVFSLRTGRGSLPYYVGKTWKSFYQEAFHTHKFSDHYQPIVADHKGTPTMTFVALKPMKGRTPEAVIKELEKHLIQMACMRNPDLSNKQNRPKTRWMIKGVIGDGPGAPSKQASGFKQLIGY